jgi:hypothetical protein
MDVSKLNEKLRTIKKEIKKIQDECPHKNKELRFTESFSIRWFCKYCQKPIDWPTKEESENWLK